jgi:hypothetical protein
MSKRIKYTDEPMEFMIVVDDLPTPDQLRRRLRKVRVTVEVDAPTVAMFRRKAGRGNAAYRRMMGRLLDAYAARESSARGR